MKKEIREMIEELCVCDYFTLDEKIKLLKIYQKLLTKQSIVWYTYNVIRKVLIK